MALGIVIAIAGLGALIGGVAAGQTWLGFIGFLLMFGGVVFATHRPAGGQGAKQKTPGPANPAKRRAFMDRLDERWDERRQNP